MERISLESNLRENTRPESPKKLSMQSSIEQFCCFPYRKIIALMEQTTKSHKEESASHPALCCVKFLNQPFSGLCVISKLTYFLFIVAVVFITCTTLQYTFILNYSVYNSNSRTLEQTVLHENESTLRTFSRVDPLAFVRGDDWQLVEENIYVYSAFYDTRQSDKYFVRIIGGARLPEANLSVMCLLKYTNTSMIHEVMAKYEILMEHHNKPSKAIYFQCPTILDEPPANAAVLSMKNYKLYKQYNWNETSWMVVHPLLNDSMPSNIGVCVRPMFNYSNVLRIAEFIAYYEAIGVSHFTFYNYDVNISILLYLQELKTNDYSINVMPWSLPRQLYSMWSLGQIASINDCIYRHMNDSKYIIIVDLDEFVTPKYMMTLQEVLNIQDNPGRKSASFIFRTTTFCSEYEQDILPPVIPPFITQSSVYRDDFIYPFLVRSKYAAKPRFVELAGIHFVWRHSPRWDKRFVPVDKVLVHHYRSNLCSYKNKTLHKGKLDIRSRKYLNKLLRSKAVFIFKKTFQILEG